jgi:hypothetical protein
MYVHLTRYVCGRCKAVCASFLRKQEGREANQPLFGCEAGHVVVIARESVMGLEIARCPGRWHQSGCLLLLLPPYADARLQGGVRCEMFQLPDLSIIGVWIWTTRCVGICACIIGVPLSKHVGEELTVAAQLGL